MADKALDASWQSYRDTVIPDGAGPVQIQECHRAFYAGACFVVQMIEHISRPNVSEEAGIALIGDVREEVMAFVEAVRARNHA